MSTSSIDSVPSEQNTVPALATKTPLQPSPTEPEQASSTTTETNKDQTTTTNSQSTETNETKQPATTTEKKQSVFEIAQEIEENLNKILKKLEQSDTEINSRIDSALNNLTTLYDKTKPIEK